MKWKNKGHELDGYAEKLLQLFQEKKEKIYIFGAGILGNNIVSAFERYHCFAGYIDNNVQKQQEGVKGHPVFSMEQYIADGAIGFIVIAADQSNIPSIEKQLNAEGLHRGKDYWIYKKFMHDVFPVLSLYRYRLLYVDLAQICLTERCSLKCKDCAHGCFAVDYTSKDLSLDFAKRSADAFFAKVDVVREFVLIGGEPFLYDELAAIIEYIGERYRKKILIFSITTNGTIIPEREILELCKKYDVLIRISNYSKTLNWLEKKHEELKRRLEEIQLSYILGKQEEGWIDYGFGVVDRGKKENELIRVFDTCKIPCREIRGSKYYYCVMARSVAENLKFSAGDEDYLDLEELDNNAKKEFLEFELGYSDKGYLDMCNYCNGADAVKYPIPAAIQMTINDK